jgi:hypothetical protein
MSIFYNGNNLLNNVNKMVTNNKNLFISTMNNRQGIFSIPLNSNSFINDYENIDVSLDNLDLSNSLFISPAFTLEIKSYFINDMVYSFYDNSIYYITQMNIDNSMNTAGDLYNFIFKYKVSYDNVGNVSLTNGIQKQINIAGFKQIQVQDEGEPLYSGFITDMTISSKGYIISYQRRNKGLTKFNEPNNPLYNDPTVRFVIFDLPATGSNGFQIGTESTVANAATIEAKSTNNPDISMPCVNVYSMTTNNANSVYIIGTIRTYDLTVTVNNQNINDNINTFLFVFSNNDGNNNLTTIFSNIGNYYMLSSNKILYKTIVYNNGFLYFTQNIANSNSTNYVVKTDLTGNVINQESYFGGLSKNGGGMTFDTNGNFYVTYDTIPSTPTNTIILATFVPCFKSGTLILTNNGYFPVESLRAGYLIQTYKHGFVPIYMIGKKEIYHPAENSRIKSQLYRCSQNKYPELFEDLIITGCHSILVDYLESEEQIQKIIEVNNDTYSTDDKIRLPACVDNKTSVYEKEGTYTIYHFALENDDYYSNYGVYANGLLVETCSKRYITELANMDAV